MGEIVKKVLAQEIYLNLQHYHLMMSWIHFQITFKVLRILLRNSQTSVRRRIEFSNSVSSTYCGHFKLTSLGAAKGA